MEKSKRSTYAVTTVSTCEETSMSNFTMRTTAPRLSLP
jgi:hypothetical protein